MKLLDGRTTATSYPTDNALIRQFRVPGYSPGENVEVILALGGTTLGTTPVASVEFSQDSAANWNTTLYTVTTLKASPFFYLPNMCLVRPTFATGGGSGGVDLYLTPPATP